MERKLTGILLDTVPYFLIVLLWLIFQKLGLAEGRYRGQRHRRRHRVVHRQICDRSR